MVVKLVDGKIVIDGEGITFTDRIRVENEMDISIRNVCIVSQFQTDDKVKEMAQKILDTDWSDVTLK